MPNLFVTLMIAFIFLIFAIALLAISWLIKSRTKMEGSCGRPPAQSQEEGCCSDSEPNCSESSPKN